MEEYSKSKQMYLKTILELEQVNEAVRCVDIAKKLEFSRPSVTNAIKKMRTDGLVSAKTDGQIRLTEKGRAAAEMLCERSKILTDFFTSLGADESLAIEEADRIEHILSEEMFEIIKRNAVEQDF